LKRFLPTLTMMIEIISTPAPTIRMASHASTTIDNALTHPWTITKSYRRTADRKPIWWRESICAENNPHVRIGKEVYYVGADGNLMPAKRNQAPPDLKYFKQSQK